MRPGAWSSTATNGSVAAAIRWRHCAPKAPTFIGQISVTSELDQADGMVGHASSWLPRILPRGVQYQGSVHEQPVATLPRRRLALVVGHDGYRQAQMKVKAGRNEQLLMRALGETPDDAYLRYQLGKDLEVREQFEGAAVHYLRALHGTGADDAWRHDLVVRTLFTLKKLGRHDAAVALAETEMPRWQGSPDFFFALGDLLLDCAASTPGSCRRAAAADRVELAARARDRRAAAVARQRSRPGQLSRGAQPRSAPCRPRP